MQIVSKSKISERNYEAKKKKKELCLSFLKVKTLKRYAFFFFSQKGLRGCGNTP